MGKIKDAIDWFAEETQARNMSAHLIEGIEIFILNRVLLN
jgi:hypothetical protein